MDLRVACAAATTPPGKPFGPRGSSGYNANMLIDTHCHLTYDGLREDQAAVVSRAMAAGVERMITIGTHGADHILALQTTERFPEVYAALGIHPHHAAEIAPEDFARLESHITASRRVLAVGECGLDYHGNSAPKDVQKIIFHRQLELAEKLGKPLILHVRDAHDDALEIMSGFRHLSFVVHCFTGTLLEVQRWIELGAYIGFTGIITYKNTPFIREAAKLVPEQKLLVETDSPYLSPQPVRKMKINEPAHVVYVAQQVALNRNLALEAVHRITTANAVTLFGAGLLHT